MGRGVGESLSAVRKLNTLHNQNLNKIKKRKKVLHFGTSFLHFIHSKKNNNKKQQYFILSYLSSWCYLWLIIFALI